MDKENLSKETETRLGMTYEQFVQKYLENDPYEFMAHIDAIWASMPTDEAPSSCPGR